MQRESVQPSPEGDTIFDYIRSAVAHPVGKVGVALLFAGTAFGVARSAPDSTDPTRVEFNYPQPGTAHCEWYDQYNTTYTFQPGDTLGDVVDENVATTFGTNWFPNRFDSVDEIAEVNGIEDASIVQAGRTVVLPRSCMK